MLTNIIPMFSQYLKSGIYEYILIYLIPLFFLATVPILIKRIIAMR